jgi:hypothetical protein
MIACPDRPRGSCPYVQKNLIQRETTLVSIGIILLGVFLIIIRLLSEGLNINGEYLSQVALGIFLIIAGFIVKKSFYIQLWNPQTRSKWKQMSFPGIQIKQILLLPNGESVPKSRASTRLSHPGSHIEYYRIFLQGENDPGVPFSKRNKDDIGAATNLFWAALSDLLSKEVVQFHPYKQLKTNWRKQKVEGKIYLVTAGSNWPAGWQSKPSGTLESMISKAISSGESQEWPDGVPIYELVRAVYKSDKGNPVKWLIKQVEHEMMAAGYFKKVGFRGRISISAELVSHFEKEVQPQEALKRWMYEENRIQRIDSLAEIKRAIESRKQQDNTHW